MIISYAISSGRDNRMHEVGNWTPIDKSPEDFADSKYLGPGDKVHIWYGADVDNRALELRSGIFGVGADDLLNSVRPPNLIIG